MSQQDMSPKADTRKKKQFLSDGERGNLCEHEGTRSGLALLGVRMNGLCLISTAWKRAKGGNAFVGFPPKITTSLGAFYRAWPAVHNTNGQDHNTMTRSRPIAPPPP